MWEPGKKFANKADTASIISTLNSSCRIMDRKWITRFWRDDRVLSQDIAKGTTSTMSIFQGIKEDWSPTDDLPVTITIINLGDFGVIFTLKCLVCFPLELKHFQNICVGKGSYVAFRKSEVGFIISSLHGGGCGINGRRMYRIRLGWNAFRTHGSDKLFLVAKRVFSGKALR